MHVVLYNRGYDDAYEGNRSSLQGKNPQYEPVCLFPSPNGRVQFSLAFSKYLDGRGLPEAGHYMEQLIFGGVSETLRKLHPPPSYQSGPNDIPAFVWGEVSPPPLLQAIRVWPWASAAHRWPPAKLHNAWLKNGAKTRVYLIPSTWSSKLLSEAFWNDPRYPRKSDNFFHNSRRFRMTAPIMHAKTTDCGMLEIVYRRNEPYLYPEENTLISDWNAQKDALYNIQGPWL